MTMLDGQDRRRSVKKLGDEDGVVWDADLLPIHYVIRLDGKVTSPGQLTILNKTVSISTTVAGRKVALTATMSRF